MTTNTVHWLCGKVECDCDDQYEAVKDEEMREYDYESDCY